MTFVVTDNCINCKYMDCVEVCPVDCFHAGPNFLVIDPMECIDCTLCEPECPAGAIYKDSDIPHEFHEFIDLNAQLSTRWPMIAERTMTPVDADKWDGVAHKIEYLIVSES